MFWAIQMTKHIFDQTPTSIQIRVVSILQNWNIMNSSHHRIFKYISFILNHHVNAINLNIVSSFSVFILLV